MPEKVLIVGCGSIGARHAGNASGRAAVAVMDTDAGRAAHVAQACKGIVVSDLDSAIAWKPDAAIVATPPRFHLEIAGRFVDAGIPVLVEKPIAPSLEGVDRLLEAAQKRNVPLHVVCNMRFHPGPATLKASLPMIGRPLFAFAHYGNYLPAMRPGADYRTLYAARRADGGGVIFDSIHEIDYLGWLLGPVESVACQAGRLGDLDIDVEDHAVLTLKHASGASSAVQLDFLRRQKSRGCEVVGTDGTLIWQSDGKSPERCTVKRIDRDGTVISLLDTSAYDGNTMYAAMLQAFLDGIAGRAGGGQIQSGLEARAALAAACAAHESAADHSRQRMIRTAA